MIYCNKDCIYQCDGNCVLDEKTAKSKGLSGNNCVGVGRKSFATSKYKVNRFTHRANVDKFNGVGDFGAD